MVTAKLKGVFKVRSKGHTYWYAWRGGPRLQGQPDTPEFIASYVAAHEANKVVDSSRVKGLIATYRASAEYRALAESTKRNWGPWLERIGDQFGELSLKQFDRPQIRIDIRRWRDRWRENPRTADYGLQVLSRVMAFAVSEGQLRLNPCFGIPRLYRVNRSELIWSHNDLEALERAASKPIYDAAFLASLTGLRRGDLLRLRWDQIGDASIELTAAKSVSKATGRSGTQVTIPMYGELREFLSSLPRKGKTVLQNTKGEPWGSGFSASWNTAMKRAKLDAKGLHFHDLRGTAATRFYRAELTPREIADVMGWSEVRVERLIDRYVKRDELIQQRIQRIDLAQRKN